ncbi:MAG: type II secretion system major pseudopilin GspG [Legionellaceae bacterium]|nr:type II secretion system major pseudopilin GspG [Legionellaceae bacterium]
MFQISPFLTVWVSDALALCQIFLERVQFVRKNRKQFTSVLSHGLTLIEIMLIVMVLAIGTSIYFRYHLNKETSIVLDKTQQDIVTIENGMKFYKLDNGVYPTTAQGISALVVKPTTAPIPKHWTQYLQAIPLNREGKPYRYVNPGKNKEIEVLEN